MEKLVKVASNLPKNKREDVFVDRLSSRYTVIILCIFAVTVSLTAWVRKPMHCWFPKYVTKYQRRYGHGYCWVANTYYLPYSEYIPKVHEHEKRRVIKYYQWIPWILLAQAFFFWFPSVVWKQLNHKSGIDVKDIVSSTKLLQNAQKLDKREGRLNVISSMFDRFLKFRGRYEGGCRAGCGGFIRFLSCQCSGRRMDSYLVAIFIISKILYFANIMFQMFSLNGLLNIHFQDYGKEFIEFNHKNGSLPQYRNSPIFPRISMCDITVRYLGNIQRHTVQCVLPLNFYAEKMYVFFWFWLLLLIAATGTDLLLWFFRAVIRKDRLNFIRNHLNSGNLLKTEGDRWMTNEFVDDYLGQDGVLVLRLVAHNTNAITTTDVIGRLWVVWRERNAENEENETLPLKRTLLNQFPAPGNSPHSRAIEEKIPLSNKDSVV